VNVLEGRGEENERNKLEEGKVNGGREGKDWGGKEEQ
jgi:hypothetical protein